MAEIAPLEKKTSCKSYDSFLISNDSGRYLGNLPMALKEEPNITKKGCNKRSHLGFKIDFDKYIGDVTKIISFPSCKYKDHQC